MSERSQDHHRTYERRERIGVERLTRELGHDVVKRLDRVTIRDILAERRQADLDELLGAEESTRWSAPARHRVVVTRRTGAARGRQAAGRRRSTRQQRVETRRRQGLRLVEPLARACEEAGGEVQGALWLTHSVVVEADTPTLEFLAARRDVATVNHDKWMFAAALDVSRPLIQADQVESTLGIGGEGVDVAILDTGVDGSHAELNLVTQQDFTGAGSGDTHGHGTHCAGVATGRGRTFRGVAPQAAVHDYKILGGPGDVMTAASITVNGMQQAVTDRMDVLSNSWGFTHRDGYWVDPDGTCVVCVAADNATEDAVVVIAGGNENSNSCGTYDTWLRCPGMARLPITVGASDDADAMADFSSRGPTPDGRAKPDVVAPGVDIVSARASTGNDMDGDAPVIDPTHVQASGTSMATPHVAGVAALMLQANAALTHQDIKDILMATAIDIGADPATEQGAGRVDALAAVNAS